MSRKNFSIINLCLSVFIICAAVYNKEIGLGIVGLIALVFSIYRYKANSGS